MIEFDYYIPPYFIADRSLFRKNCCPHIKPKILFLTGEISARYHQLPCQEPRLAVLAALQHPTLQEGCIVHMHNVHNEHCMMYIIHPIMLT